MRRVMTGAGVLLLAGLVVGQEEREITVESMPPVVVKTVPQAGDMEVDPGLKEMQVTFSKDMETEMMWAWCQVSAEHFPKSAGAVHYLADNRTCVKPVELEAGKTYCVWLNLGKFNSFRDRGNRPAVPYLLVFKTRDKTEK